VRRRRWPGRDRGSFTAELAAGLPALMLLFGFGLTAVTAAAAKMQCLDAAREAALAGARGAEAVPVAARIAPDGASVLIGGTAESVTAEVAAPVRMFGADLPGFEVRATAVAAREPEEVSLP
jgi:hypothetical protein